MHARAIGRGPSHLYNAVTHIGVTMITAYRSDTIRNGHRAEYESYLGVPRTIADTVECPRCSTSYSFFYDMDKHDPAFLRNGAREILKLAHPDHSETLIRLPENQEEAKAHGLA